MRKHALAMLCAPLLLAACSEVDEGHMHVGRSLAQLAHPGPWVIPEATLAKGDSQWVLYTSAGPWVGEDGCSPGFTPGGQILRDYLYAHFPQPYHIGGYNCRPIVGNESQMSLHATGRALDIMIYRVDGEADNDLGDPVGNWLVENAEAIGIQYVIWDLYTWMAEREPGSKGKDYGGEHPHDDHLHIELSVEASENTSPWFDDAVETPIIEGCEAIALAGGIIEETDACFGAFGPSEFWRLVEDGGHDGSLLWTNAFENDNPSNWARWTLMFEEAGSYHVEVYVDPSWGVHQETRYGVRHAGGDAIVVVDQSAEQGWVSLGNYQFEADLEAFVDVFDNMSGAVEPDQRIAVDALRLTGSGYDPPGLEHDVPGHVRPDGSAFLPGGASGIRGDDSGCSVSSPVRSTAPSAGGWLALVLGVMLGRRRRRFR